jgi:anti-sigma-K factor RskA
MKPTCELQSSGTIEMYFYDELPVAERQQVARHIRACADCRAAIEQVEDIQRALATRPEIAAPPGDDWSGFMARLGAATTAADRKSHAAENVHEGMSATRWSRFGLMATAALLALTTIGVMFALRSRPPITPVAGVPAAHLPDTASPADNQGFEALSEEHFERSKLVVLGLAAKDPAQTKSADWVYERELAATLLSDTRIYRMAAEDRGLRSIADVMGDLELVLLQASFADERDPASLAQIQRLIRRRDLVEKMDVVAVSGL